MCSRGALPFDPRAAAISSFRLPPPSVVAPPPPPHAARHTLHAACRTSARRTPAHAARSTRASGQTLTARPPLVCTSQADDALKHPYLETYHRQPLETAPEVFDLDAVEKMKMDRDELRAAMGEEIRFYRPGSYGYGGGDEAASGAAASVASAAAPPPPPA